MNTHIITIIPIGPVGAHPGATSANSMNQHDDGCALGQHKQDKLLHQGRN